MAALRAARGELERLEAEGHGEGFGPAADGTSRASFEENAQRKRAYDDEALAARARLAEATATAADGGGGAVAELRRRVSRAEAESANLRDILLRQKSIRGFWVAPKASWVRQAARVRQLEATCRELTMA